MPAQTFSTLDVLRLEVEDDPVGLANLVPNPVGTDVRGGWGWLTPLDGTRTTGGTSSLNFLGGFPKLNNYWTSEDMAIAGGQYAAAVARAKKFTTTTVNSALKIRFEWVDAAGTVTLSAQSALVVLTSGITYQQLTLGAQQAPAGTVKFRLRFDMFDSAGGTTSPSGADVSFKDNTVAKAATSAALAGLTFIPPLGYTNILGPTHEITIDRDELDIGLLTASVLDAALDPATTPRLRPGRKVRVTTLDPITAEWEPLFVGKIRNAKVTYDLTRTDAKRASISLSAIDNTAKLASVPRAAGYALIADLPKVLEGCGVPWRVNGSTGGVANGAAPVANNPNASALDQVAVTRDSERGYAWVDRVGVLQAWTSGTISTAIAATLGEDDYAALLVDYDTDRCINTVNLKYLRINLATGDTVEVPYGPYKDQASIDQWDVRSADFTIQGMTESAANMAAYAAAVLAANGTPTVRVNELVLPISTPTDVTKALLDLYDMVTITNANAAMDVDLRVTGVEHVIATDKWLTRLKFANAGGVAPPQATPSPGSGAGANLPDSVALNFGGPWSAAAPGPTSGIPFTCKAGVLRGLANATGYTTSGSQITVLLHIDGIPINNMVMYPALSNNVHLSLAQCVINMPVTAGTHYIYYRQMTGNSDAFDVGNVFGVVTPT